LSTIARYLDLRKGTTAVGGVVLYLLKPNQPMVWSDLPGSLLESTIGEGGDPDVLEWTPDSPPDDVVLGLALRHGTALSNGIVLDGGLMYLHNRAKKNVEEAAAELSKQLDAPVKPALQEFWISLGGDLPKAV